MLSTGHNKDDDDHDRKFHEMSRLNDGCRTNPSSVMTSASYRGSTHVVSRFLIGVVSGHVGRAAALLRRDRSVQLPVQPRAARAAMPACQRAAPYPRRGKPHDRYEAARSRGTEVAAPLRKTPASSTRRVKVSLIVTLTT